MKNKILSKAYGGVTVARRKLYGLGLPRQWKVITSTLLLLFTFAIGNVWAELTAHTPGIYEKAADKGGFGIDLTTYAGNQYEVYYFSANSKYGNTCTGASKQQYRLMAADSDSEHILFSDASNEAPWAKNCGWIETNFATTGFAKSDYTYGANTFNEFFAIAPNGGNSGYTKTCYIKPKNGDVLTLKVSGYVEFAILGADNGSSKYMTITVDGGTPTSWKSNTLSRRSVELTTGEHTIVVAVVGTSANNLYGFSLKLPAATKHTVTYDLNGATGTTPTQADVAEGAKFTLHNGTTGITAPTNKDFDGWHDGTTKYVGGAEYTMGTSNVTLTAQWKDHVANYTVIYKDGTTELGSETVEVGQHPTGSEIAAPTKDCYTFAGWDPALSGVSGSDGDEIEVNATWTPNYAFGAYSFVNVAEVGTAPNKLTMSDGNTVNVPAGSRVDNFYFSAMAIKYESGASTALNDYKGWKINTQNATIKFLVENNSQVKVAIGSKDAINVTYTEPDGTAKNAISQGQQTEVSYLAKAGTLFTIKTATANTTTLKRITISPLYNATYTDGTGDASGSASNVTEVTLPTPSATTVGSYSFTGWVANQTVYDGETPKTAGEALNAGGTYTLTATTTFTAQWALISDFDVKFFQGYGDPDVQIGETQSISTGNFAAAPTDPERTGFAFLGWSYDGTEAHIVDVATYGITAETNFRAMWKAVWTVTFDGAGNVNVENGETVASPNSPVMAGKVFQGWYNAEVKYDFSAAVTGNLALTSKWADADANHYYYNYKDDFHFDGVVYKTPEGKVAGAMGSGDVGGDTYSLTTPYTLFSGEEGITSIIATKAIYDSKNNWVNAYLKINNSAESYLTFIIKTGYTAVLKMKMGGYSADPTITLKKGEDVVVATSGEPGGKKASIENNFNEFTYELTAGTYTLTTATKTLYISHIDLEAEALPTYSVTYKAGEGTGDDVVDANTYYAGDEVTLMANPFTAPTGKIWSEWSVKDGNEDEVTVSSNKFIMPGSDVTATAVWVDDNGMARLYRSDDTEDANSPYATLAEAVAAAQDGDKIVLQRNVADGAGIMLTKDDHKTLTIDFGGYTYTAVSPGVGSAGTQNQAFHLEKGNTVTLKNGTITSSGSTIKMLIQNYCDLTLENITLDGTGLEGSHRYVMSNNCGDVVIGDGTTITAKADDVAFDVCATNYYPEGVTVTVKDGATVNGIVEYDVWGTKPADNKAELAIEGGTLNITWNVESALAEDAKSNLNVSGGAFAEVVPLDYCAEGFIPVTEADPITGKYEVTPGYKVTFIDGSEELEKVAVAAGSAVAEKELAGKMGYDFDAWYTKSTFENAWDFATVVAADMSLYAKWVAFEGCTELWPATSGAALSVGDIVDLQTGSKGGSIKVANLGAAGSIAYNANGLSFSNGGKDSVLVTLNNDLKNGSVIKVRLMANGGTKDNGRGLNLLNAARVKKALLGWQANEEVTSGDIREFTYTVVESDGFAGTNVFTLQRQNSVFLQSIKVEECGAAIVYHNLTSAVNIAGKGTVTLGATSVREGYTTTATYSEIDPLYEFVNWTVSGAGASVENATANPATITVGTEDAVVTLNLQVKPVYYTVTYYDGASEKGTEQVAENGHPTATGITTKKLGYNFLGWSETDGGAVVELNNISITADKDLYAKYEAIVCPTSGTVYKFQLKTNLTNGNVFATAPNSVQATTDNYLSELEGGEVTFSVTGTNNNRILFYDQKAVGFANGSGGQITMTLECPLKENDEIRFINYASSGNRMTLSDGTNSTTLDGNGKTDVQTFVVPAAWETTGSYELTLVRNNNTPKLTYFEIYRRPEVTGVTIADFTIREGASTIPTMTLSPSDDARVTSQAWSILSGDDKITINATTGEVTGVAQGDAEIKVVLNGDPAISATATVHVVESYVQQDVDEPIVWDFSKAGVVSSAFSEQVLANVDGVTLDASQFEATKLVGSANNITDTYFQGTMLTFNATKAGLLNVRFTNGNANVRTLKVYVGDPEVEIASWSYSKAAVENKFIEVPAGKVTLRSYQESSPNNVRIMNLEFLAVGHERTVVVGDLGTVCLPNACIARGVTVYEYQGADEIGKIVFDELGANDMLEAGKPYIFQVRETNARFYYNTNPAVGTPDNSTALKGNLGATITFQPGSAEAANVYFVKDHAFWMAKNTGVKIGQYRAYLQMDEVTAVSTPAPAPGRRRISMAVYGEQVATGIENTGFESEAPRKVLINGEMFIIRGEKMYDAKGQLVK